MENLFLKITRIIKETSDSKTFYFKANRIISYKAGQFVTLLLEIEGKEWRRSYSLGSTPQIDEDLFITFKRLENGTVSRYMFDKVQEGDVLKALSPKGKFILEPGLSLYFFIAAGSGITPIYSLIKKIFNRDDSRIVLLYQNNNEANTIYRKDLLNLQKQFINRFTLIEIFSNPMSNSYRSHRLNNYSLEQIIISQATTSSLIFYLCGPKDFMRMAEFTLKVMGYDAQQIRKENFVIDSIPPAPL